MKARSLVASFLTLFGGGGAACDKSSSLPPPPPAPTVSTVEGGADPTTGVVRYLAMGDSLTQGVGAKDVAQGNFAARVAAKWRARGCQVELKNLGVTRYTAQDVITNQVPEIAVFKPTLITLQVGSNDVANKVPVDTFRKNVSIILDAATKSGARVIVFPQNEWFRSPEGPSYGTDLANKRAEFDKVLMEETQKAKGEVVDLRLLFRQQADRKQWYSDGIHPSEECYEQWAAELARVVPSPCGK